MAPQAIGAAISPIMLTFLRLFERKDDVRRLGGETDHGEV